MSGATGHFAPGRVEILGKHTDYAGGNVLVCAVDRGVSAIFHPGGTGLTARSSAMSDAVDLNDAAAALPRGHWGNYLRATVARLQANFGPLAPGRVEISSDLPLASGMSSSSALIVATAMALVRANGFDTTQRWAENIHDDVQLAGYLACVENGRTFGGLAGSMGVGTHGGSEDHTAMLCSTPDHLGLFSFNPPSLVRRVELPADLALVVAVSGVAAEKTGSALEAYNAASAGTAEVLRRWNADGHDHPNLAAAVESAPGARQQLRTMVASESVLVARLDQFIAESTRIIPAAVDALAAGDLSGFGRAVAESQALAAQGLRNQVPETQALVRQGLELGAVAASAFGAGFGGSVWALVDRPGAADFAAAWVDRYCREFPAHADLATTLVTRPAAPARALG